MTPEELSTLEIEVKLLDIHWLEILKVLHHLPQNERFFKKEQLEWLVKKGQPALRELVLEHRVHEDQLQEITGLIDDCMQQMTRAKDEIDRLRALARESQQFVESLSELRQLHEKEFQRMHSALHTAGYEPLGVA